MIPRISSGSSRAASAVEPTRSQNITVSWRRSAVSLPGADGDVDTPSAIRAAGVNGAESRPIADKIVRRCPIKTTPSCVRSSTVSFGRTLASISFSRKAASYWPNPRLRSQSPTSIVARPGSSMRIMNRRGHGVQGPSFEVRTISEQNGGTYAFHKIATSCWCFGRCPLQADCGPSTRIVGTAEFRPVQAPKDAVCYVR